MARLDRKMVRVDLKKDVRIAHHLDPTAGGKVRRTRICRKCGQTLDKR
jgi:hypothetical protein